MANKVNLVPIKLYVRTGNGKVEQRTMYAESGLNIQLNNNHVYKIGKDGLYINGKKYSGLKVSASEYSIMSGVGLTESEGLPENKRGNSFVLTNKDLQKAYQNRHEETPDTQRYINNAASLMDAGESLHMNNADYKVTQKSISVHTRKSSLSGGGTHVSIFTE